jgi:hypothetical protein
MAKSEASIDAPEHGGTRPKSQMCEHNRLRRGRTRGAATNRYKAPPRTNA